MNKQILEVVSAVSIEKDVDKEIIFEALEEAISSATKKLIGEMSLVNVKINRDTGDYETFREWDIVDEDELEDESFQILKANAKDKDDNGKVSKKIDNIDFGRISAQAAKQVIIQKVREAERTKITSKYENLIGQVVLGQIKRINKDFLLVEIEEDLNAQIPRDQIIPGEIFKLNDRVRAVIKEIISSPRGPQIVLSRTDDRLVKELFTQEVPEISEGTIEIKSVARDPGSRAKICVHSQDSSIDPVGACVGMRGSRVQTIVNELHGEKIDIIKWTEDLPTLISESLSPAEIQKVLIDQDNKRIDIILTEENLSKAIGRRGQNVRLASKLTNYEIDILTDKEDSERRQAEFKDRTENLIKNLEVDETLGQLLVSEGFTSIDEIAQSSSEEISKIDAIDEETAKELINRSKETLVKEKEAVSIKLKALGVDEKLINLKGMTQGMLVILGQKNIKKISDFADLSSDELIGGFDEIKGKKIRIEGYLEEFALSRKEADDLIMAAREIVYK